MNQHMKSFLHRGLVFGGFGPIVLGIVYGVLESTMEGFSLTGWQVLMAIVSTYLLAFAQAGASVFNQIEEWPLPKSLLCHFGLLYLAYTLCYLLNSWIPFKVEVVLIFTAVFVVTYLVIWGSVYLTVKGISKKMNRLVQ